MLTLIIYYFFNGNLVYTNYVGNVPAEKCYWFGAQAVVANEHRREYGVLTKYECKEMDTDD